MLIRGEPPTSISARSKRRSTHPPPPPPNSFLLISQRKTLHLTPSQPSNLPPQSTAIVRPRYPLSANPTATHTRYPTSLTYRREPESKKHPPPSPPADRHNTRRDQACRTDASRETLAGTGCSGPRIEMLARSKRERGRRCRRVRWVSTWECCEDGVRERIGGHEDGGTAWGIVEEAYSSQDGDRARDTGTNGVSTNLATVMGGRGWDLGSTLNVWLRGVGRGSVSFWSGRCACSSEWVGA